MRIITHFINTFILGKGAHTIRIAAAMFIRSLWEIVPNESKDQIFDYLLSKMPTLHSLGSKAVEFFHLLNYIAEKREWTNSSKEELKNIFSQVKKSLINTNDLLFTHQNLELYSNFYKLISSGG